MGGTTPRTADQQHMPHHDHAHHQRQQAGVQQQHLAEIGDVEEGADADGVEAVLGLEGNPLRIEVASAPGSR